MGKLKTKLILSLVVFVISVLAIAISVYGANEKIEIVKKTGDNYLIYIEGNEKTAFEFGYSSAAGVEPVTYYTAGTDGEGNNVAYINSTILADSPTYMWAREVSKPSNYIVNGITINLADFILETDIQNATKVTARIPVNITQTPVEERDEDGVAVTIRVGKVELTDTSAKYEYQIVKLPSTTDYNTLMSLAKMINAYKNSSNITMVEKIQTYNAFWDLYSSLEPTATDSKWLAVTNNEILQPEDTEEDDEYIVWIKQTKGDNVTIDAQFMTSTKEYEQEKTKEMLPVTGDDNTLLIVFGVLAVSTLIVYVVLRKLEKKEEK